MINTLKQSFEFQGSTENQYCLVAGQLKTIGTTSLLVEIKNNKGPKPRQ